MQDTNACLVLEGGALRGVYTAGVQGSLHRAGFTPRCLIGTSAGAINGMNFLSGQPERSYRIDYRYADDPNFMGPKSLVTQGQVFSFKYMFGAVNDWYPLDEAAFLASPIRYMAVSTDLETGQPAYLEKGVCGDIFEALKATSSMPGLSTPVLVDGRRYLDGGPSMPVAYQKALDEGCGPVILVLTRQKGYRKKPFSPALQRYFRFRYRKYPQFVATMLSSPDRYNRMMDEIDGMERSGRLFVIRPQSPVTVDRMEKNKEKLRALFIQGRKEAAQRLPDLETYLAQFPPR